MNFSRISTAIILFALTVNLSAQKREKQTVILNGGSRLTGTILVDSSDYLKLRITSPQVITLKKSEISLITPAKDIKKPVAGDRHGYSIRISASVLAGRNSEGNIRSMSFHLSNGYGFRNGMSVGFGAGIEELDIALLPVYTDLRFYPFKSRLSPFVWTKSGWSFTFGDQDDGQYYYGSYPDSKGGFMFNTGAGIELASWRRNAVNIGLGYRYQKIRFKSSNNWGEVTTNELVTSFNRIEVQFGFIFR